MNMLDELDRLRPFAVEPPREAMGGGVRFPTPGARLLVVEMELARLREALRQAIAIADTLLLADRAKEIPPPAANVIQAKF